MSKAYLTYAGTPIGFALLHSVLGAPAWWHRSTSDSQSLKFPHRRTSPGLWRCTSDSRPARRRSARHTLQPRCPQSGLRRAGAIAPWFFPTGAEITFVDGNPNIDEAFLVRLAFPKNYRIPPHYHGTDIHVEVQQGAIAIGFGDRMDLHQTRVLAAGDTASVQAGTRYYIATRATTLIAMRSRGPFTLTYVHPDDDPSRHLPLGR